MKRTLSQNIPYWLQAPFMGGIESHPISPKKESQYSGNCRQALSAERTKSEKSKKLLENDCFHKTHL